MSEILDLISLILIKLLDLQFVSFLSFLVDQKCTVAFHGLKLTCNLFELNLLTFCYCVSSFLFRKLAIEQNDLFRVFELEDVYTVKGISQWRVDVCLSKEFFHRICRILGGKSQSGVKAFPHF